MAKQVESVYGDALFELATEQNRVDELLEEVVGLLDVLNSNPGYTSFMTHPRVTKEEKKSITEDIFKGKISDELLGLLITINEKGHFADTGNVLTYFVSRVRELRNIGVATVTTPIPLSESEQHSVEKRLLETTPYVSLEMSYEVDPSLIGGMVIRIGDRVVDSSIKTKLEQLSRDLYKIQLKVGESTP